MSENKKFFEKLKDLVNTRLEGEEKKVELATMELENGTVLEAEAFEDGNSVIIVNEDERVPLPVGEYELKDGMMLNVTEEGIIASIGAKAEEEEMSTEYVTMDQFNEAIDSIKSMLKSEFEKVEELSKEKEELEKENKEVKEELETKETELKEASVEPLKKAPVEVEFTQSKTKKGRILQSIQENKN